MYGSARTNTSIRRWIFTRFDGRCLRAFLLVSPSSMTPFWSRSIRTRLWRLLISISMLPLTWPSHRAIVTNHCTSHTWYPDLKEWIMDSEETIASRNKKDPKDDRQYEKWWYPSTITHTYLCHILCYIAFNGALVLSFVEFELELSLVYMHGMSCIYEALVSIGIDSPSTLLFMHYRRYCYCPGMFISFF